MSGILTAFSGYWLTNLLSDRDTNKSKNLETRLIFILFALIIGLTTVMIGMASLVNDDLATAYQVTIIGTGIIITVVVEIFVLTISKWIST